MKSLLPHQITSSQVPGIRGGRFFFFFGGGQIHYSPVTLDGFLSPRELYVQDDRNDFSWSGTMALLLSHVFIQVGWSGSPLRASLPIVPAFPMAQQPSWLWCNLRLKQWETWLLRRISHTLSGKLRGGRWGERHEGGREDKEAVGAFLHAVLAGKVPRVSL